MTVRVRFAPSPTGFLHIGNARAALINWLFAKQHQGSFMLRLDDTDLERSKDHFADAIKEDLAWLGLTHDQFAKQSDRFDRYKQAMEQLIDSGRLYPCYETPEELDFKRKRQLSRGEPPIYDRAALQLDNTQKKDFESQGRQPHWRFKLEPGLIQWNDLVRGPVEFYGERLSDPVLVRADGAYLYTITSVVDDLDFKITHILRGEDHVTNTAVQIQLFSALNNNQPIDITFGHTTLLVGAKGEGLSKRLGSLGLSTLRENSIKPMAINSFLARLGTSLPIEPVTTLEELASHFDLSTFSRTPPRFEENELTLLNQKLVHILPYDHVKDELKDLGLEQFNESIWNIIKSDLSKVKDAVEWQNILFGDIKTIEFDAEDKVYIQKALDNLSPIPWSRDTWSLWTNTLKEITGRKGKSLFMPLRQALTGMDHGPEMKELLFIIGFEKAKERLKKVLL